MKLRKINNAFCIVALVLLIFSTLGFTNNFSNMPSNKSTSVKKHKSLYPRNKRGQTYGIPIKDDPPELFPDLIPAIGDNGKKGYIKLKNNNLVKKTILVGDNLAIQ